MKKIKKYLTFENFILNENCTQRNSAICTAVSKIKEEFGDTKKKFLKSAEKKGVDEIKDVLLPVLRLILEARRLQFDRDAALPLDIHIVEVLFLHIAGLDKSGLLDQAVCKCRLAVVYVGNNAEISDVV